MAFSRTAVFRSTLLRGTRSSALSRPQVWRQVARRGYASGHGHAKSGGDAVWAAGAVAVTVPTCWYLIANGPDTSHHSGHGGHEDHGSEHHEEKEEEEEPKEEESKEEEPKEEETEEKSEEGEKKDDKESEKSDEADSDDKSSEADKPGSSVTGEDEKNVRKHIPDAKGANKKRIESKQSISQDNSDPEDTSDDKAAAAKETGGKNSQSGKQEGLSNTDTKHSTDIQNDPEKSKKGEGMPETAKTKGTVKIDRPQPESDKE